MSQTISMPLNANPHLRGRGTRFGFRRMITWMYGANDRYAHALKPRKPRNRIYMAGWESTRPNGNLTK